VVVKNEKVLTEDRPLKGDRSFRSRSGWTYRTDRLISVFPVPVFHRSARKKSIRRFASTSAAAVFGFPYAPT
jgi:hypothetical protein